MKDLLIGTSLILILGALGGLVATVCIVLFADVEKLSPENLTAAFVLLIAVSATSIAAGYASTHHKK